MKITFYLLASWLCFCRLSSGQQPNDRVDGSVVRTAATLLLDNHLRQAFERRDLSISWAHEYLRALDPRKMHFLESDEVEFLLDASSLLDDALEGRVEFPLRVARRFSERFNANQMLISKLLEEEYDFTIDESFEFKHQDYSVDTAACNQRWRLRIKYELLLENLHASSSTLSLEFLRGRYVTIKTHFDSLSQSKLLSLYIDSLAKVFDPHSAYLDEETLTTFRTGQISNFTLGLQLVYNDGDLWIHPAPCLISSGARVLVGSRVVAVQVPGSEPVHLSGLTRGAAALTIISSIFELGHAQVVILEIDNPKRGQRRTVACDRWQSGR